MNTAVNLLYALVFFLIEGFCYILRNSHVCFHKCLKTVCSGKYFVSREIK
jgi:hypothetical protein